MPTLLSIIINIIINCQTASVSVSVSVSRNYYLLLITYYLLLIILQGERERERERERGEESREGSEEVTGVLFLRSDLPVLYLFSVWRLSVSCFWFFVRCSLLINRSQLSSARVNCIPKVGGGFAAPKQAS